ncbi:MAG: ISL3 family transposase, partial [Rhodospirillales bacterium]|nr:ISL3 family transposase [Rhodospirillales bacterium]
MRDTDLFQLALGINSPWFVASSDFDGEKKRLDIEIDFKSGARFSCPDCKAADCPVHDTTRKTWRHLDFFQHQAFLHARTPRITCTKCGVRRVEVPWARPGSGFTLLFEALAMTLVIHMPVAAAARMLGEHDTKLWRVVHHYVEEALAGLDLSALRRVCIDETAAKRGHNYITLFVDIDARKVVFIAEGRGAGTVAQFADWVDAHNSDASRIKEVCIDMSGAYIAGVSENLTEAEITFDRFHVMKLIGEAVDKVRRTETKSRPELKGSRYLWLKNDVNLTSAQKAERGSLAKANLKTGRAWAMRLAFQDIYKERSRDWAGLVFERWCSWARRSKLEPMKAVAATLMRHADGILAWFDTRIANGLIEGINSLVQAARPRREAIDAPQPQSH